MHVAPALMALQEVAAAYEIVGDPDKRAIFDDFGHDHKAFAMHACMPATDGLQGFETHWEFEQTRSKGSSDFYNEYRLVHKLTTEVRACC